MKVLDEILKWIILADDVVSDAFRWHTVDKMKGLQEPTE